MKSSYSILGGLMLIGLGIVIGSMASPSVTAQNPPAAAQSPPAKPDRVRWEFKVQTTSDSALSIQNKLNELGSIGFDYVDLVPPTSEEDIKAKKVKIIMKRERLPARK